MKRIRSEDSLRQILIDEGVVQLNGHYVYTAGDHGSYYSLKELVAARPHLISMFCREIASHYGSAQVQTVIGPDALGASFATWTAYHLLSTEVQSCFAQKNSRGNFKLRSAHVRMIRGRRVVIVDDNLTTGHTIRLLAQLVIEHGGIPVGVGVMCKRGDVTAESLGVPELFYATSLPTENWDEKSCRLCQNHVPINTDLGKGRQYLARIRREARLAR